MSLSYDYAELYNDKRNTRDVLIKRLLDERDRYYLANREFENTHEIARGLQNDKTALEDKVKSLEAKLEESRTMLLAVFKMQNGVD